MCPSAAALFATINLTQQHKELGAWGVVQVARKADHSARVDLVRSIKQGRFVTAGENGEVKFWDVLKNTELLTQPRKHSNSFVVGLELAQNGNKVFTSSDELWEWSLRSVPIKPRLIGRDGGMQLTDLSLLKGERSIAVSSVDNSVCVFNIATKKATEHWIGERVTQVQCLNDGKHLIYVCEGGEIRYTTSPENALFCVFALESGETIRQVELPAPSTNLLLLPNDTTFIYGSTAGELVWWDFRKSKANRIVQVHSDNSIAIESLTLSTDGRLALTTRDNQADLWRVRGGVHVQSFIGHQDIVHDACFLGHNRVVTVSRDASVRVWNTASGDEIDSFSDAPAKRKRIASYLTDPWSIEAVDAYQDRILAGEASGRVRILQCLEDNIVVLR